MRQFIHAWATILLIASLSACTTITLEPLPEGMTDQPPANWQARSTKLSQFDHWKLQGKLAVRQPSDSGTALINHWKQEGEAYDIALSSSFLGMGSTSLIGMPGFMELTLSSGEVYRSGDPDALVKAATGWQLPLENLTWWIRGLPAPDGDFRLLFDNQGELAMIRQAGWEIRYDRWHEPHANTPALPARVTALKEKKRVRVVVSSWQDLTL